MCIFTILSLQVAWLWALFFAFSAPEVLTLIRSVRAVINQGYTRPSLKHFLVVFVMESLHVLGTAILFFIALPGVDTVKGLILTNCLAILPGLLRMFMTPPFRCSKIVHSVICAMSTIAQISSLILWTVTDNNQTNIWSLPVGMGRATPGNLSVLLTREHRF